MWNSVLEVAQQVEHLGLDRHVEGRGRLVGDEQVGVAGDRAGDQHALRHAAGDLVRVRRERALRVGDADPGEQAERPVLGLVLAETQADPHRLGQLAADGEGRVEVGHRLLRDVGDLAAAQLGHLLLGDVGEVGALELDDAGQDPAARRQQAAGPRTRSGSCPSRTRRPGRAPRRVGRSGTRRGRRSSPSRRAGRSRPTGRGPRAAPRRSAAAALVVARGRRPARGRPPAGAAAPLRLRLRLGADAAALELVAQGVAEQRERDAGQADGQAGPQQVERLGVDVGEARR